MSETLPAALRQSVVQRAQGRCEYCLIHEDHTLLAHHVDHVIARKHGGGLDPRQPGLGLRGL